MHFGVKWDMKFPFGSYLSLKDCILGKIILNKKINHSVVTQTNSTPSFFYRRGPTFWNVLLLDSGSKAAGRQRTLVVFDRLNGAMP